MVVEKSTPEGIHFSLLVALEFMDGVIDAVSLIMDEFSKDSIRWSAFSCIALGSIWVKDALSFDNSGGVGREIRRFKRRRPLAVGLS